MCVFQEEKRWTRKPGTSTPGDLQAEASKDDDRDPGKCFIYILVLNLETVLFEENRCRRFMANWITNNLIRLFKVVCNLEHKMFGSM